MRRRTRDSLAAAVPWAYHPGACPAQTPIAPNARFRCASVAPGDRCRRSATHPAGRCTADCGSSRRWGSIPRPYRAFRYRAIRTSILVECEISHTCQPISELLCRPFLAGFSTNLVLVILGEFVVAIEAVFGLSGRT